MSSWEEQDEEEEEDMHAMRRTVIDLCAGTVGGIAQTIVGHPLDTIKVRLQAGKEYSGVVHCFRSIVREEKVFGLFKGLLSPLTGIAALNAVLFTSYGFAKNQFESRQDEDLSILQITACGVFAGIAQCSVVCPMELIKVRLQSQHGNTPLYKGNLDCIRKTIRARGFRGLYAGMYGCLLREIPAYGACFLTYESCQRALASFHDCEVNDLGAGSLIFAGGFGGIMCWVCSYPQDVILTRLRTQPINRPPIYPKRFLDGGFWSCARHLVRREGYKGLMRGFSACALRAFPANAASFAAYEFSKEFFMEHFDS